MKDGWLSEMVGSLFMLQRMMLRDTYYHVDSADAFCAGLRRNIISNDVASFVSLSDLHLVAC